jgi:predicted nuclease of predicted toxin-antitoxin system
LDADVDVKLAGAIRDEGFDAVSAREIGTDFLLDIQQLEFAIAEQRTVLTHNFGDFANLHDEYLRDGKMHYGIVVAEQLSIGVLLRRCLNMLDKISADEIMNTFHNLGEFK